MTSGELDLYRNRCYTMVVVQAPIERRRPTTAATKYRHRDATFFYLPRAPPTSTQHVYLR
jgi:hypothetical protein